MYFRDQTKWIMKALKVTRMTAEEIYTLLHEKPEYQIGIRLAVVLQVAKGATSRDVALDLPFGNHVTVCNWIKRFNAQGVAGLIPKDKPGKPSKATIEQLNEIKHIVLQVSPEEYGYNTATWTGPLLIDWLAKHKDIHIKRASIYVWLKKKIGLSYKKGKGFYPEADEQLRSQWVSDIKKTSEYRA